VKLIKKVRVGSKLKRIYDAPKTPFQRVCESADTDSVKVARLTQQLKSLDPFLLSQAIEQKLDRIYNMANNRKGPIAPSIQKENVLKENKPCTKKKIGPSLSVKNAA